MQSEDGFKFQESAPCYHKERSRDSLCNNTGLRQQERGVAAAPEPDRALGRPRKGLVWDARLLSLPICRVAVGCGAYLSRNHGQPHQGCPPPKDTSQGVQAWVRGSRLKFRHKPQVAPSKGSSKNSRKNAYDKNAGHGFQIFLHHYPLNSISPQTFGNTLKCWLV